jgi:hypothetical protein
MEHSATGGCIHRLVVQVPMLKLTTVPVIPLA